MAPHLLLISANTETTPLPVYPLALARLAGAAHDAGFAVTQFDPLVHGLHTLPDMLALHPDLVGISLRNIDNTSAQTTRSYVGECQTLMALVRRHTPAPIVLGGSGFSLFPQHLMALLRPDYGVAGPGEGTLCDLFCALSRGDPLPPGPALLPSRPLAAAPLRHDDTILQHYLTHAGMLGLQTKTGCPFACSYCTYPALESHLRVLDPSALVEQLAELAHRGARFVFLVDSVFNLAPDQELAFAEALAARHLPLSWAAFFRPAGLTRAYLQTLVHSGLTHMEFGTDSLAESMLASYRKSFTVADVLHASRLAADAGVHQAHYLILGGPGETPGTLHETMANARRLTHPVMLPFVGVRVFPRTPLHATAIAQGLLSPDDPCLQPVHYLAPGLDFPTVRRIVNEGRDPATPWILPDAYAGFARLVARLRRAGKVGPMWEMSRLACSA